MVKEEEVRKKVKSLKRFYMDSFTFLIVNAALILIWVAGDSNTTFWPKYVILTWGIVLIVQAYQMGVFPLFSQHLSFLTPEWEEKKIKKLTVDHQDQRRIYLNRDRKK